jgi:hypothetical protein
LQGFSPLRFSSYAKDLSSAVLGLSMQFDLGKISKGDLVKELDRGDVAAGSTDRVISWRDNQILEVQWTPQETKPMSVTGFEPGAIRAKLDGLKQKARDRRAQSMAKLDAAHEMVASVDAEIEKVAAQIEKEAAAGLQEFAEFTNGGPV